MRISDWSSDVCSSDLTDGSVRPGALRQCDHGPGPGVGRVGGRVGLCSGAQAVRQADRRFPGSPDQARRNAHEMRGGTAAHLARRGERAGWARSEEHTSELQSLMRISYAVFCLKKKNTTTPLLNINLS